MTISLVTKASILTSVCSCNGSSEYFSSLKISKPLMWEDPWALGLTLDVANLASHASRH
jgi:hypothetical protein